MEGIESKSQNEIEEECREFEILQEAVKKELNLRTKDLIKGHLFLMDEKEKLLKVKATKGEMIAKADKEIELIKKLTGMSISASSMGEVKFSFVDLEFKHKRPVFIEIIAEGGVFSSDKVEPTVDITDELVELNSRQMFPLFLLLVREKLIEALV